MSFFILYKIDFNPKTEISIIFSEGGDSIRYFNIFLIFSAMILFIKHRRKPKYGFKERDKKVFILL